MKRIPNSYFFSKLGTKWSQLAKKCPQRTEHNVKNQFFSILAKYYETSVWEIRETCNYKNPKLLF